MRYERVDEGRGAVQSGLRPSGVENAGERGTESMN
jgi:hypothetical protein